ncbi:SDR family oxidoreductase [Pantoea agglomerans]|uniref:SDR family oxidoreductase n=1 Tax=Enterobacter agglomerans TaxID=549 RepID=UPI003C7EA54C
MNVNLKGKTAIVTCGTSGIGLSCVKMLASEGVNVTAISRGIVEQPDFKNEKFEGSISWLTADITEKNDIELILENRPNIDILIFIPIRERNCSINDINEVDFKQSYENTFFPFLLLMKEYLPNMRENKYGRFISCLGASTIAPLWDHSLSNVSRISIASLVSSSAREFSRDGITFNNLILGLFETPGLEKLWSERLDEHKNLASYREQRIEKIPGNKIGDPEQCAMLATLLCSPTMSYLTGQSINIDGGYTLKI